MQGCIHEGFIDENGLVSLSNNDDPWYVQTFETEKELDDFINELIEIKQKAFNKKEEKQCT